MTIILQKRHCLLVAIHSYINVEFQQCHSSSNKRKQTNVHTERTPTNEQTNRMNTEKKNSIIKILKNQEKVR